MKKVAIVGGGPGGLFAARILAETAGDLCSITMFEALDRLGGKLISRSFAAAPVTYDAGVAEFYDYSRFSDDPLRTLVDNLGLATIPLKGSAVIIGDRFIRTDGDIKRKLGSAAADAVHDFHARCENACSTDEYYKTYWRLENRHPLANRTFADLLDEIPDELA
jgi:phytoene dehydrogenase-like protein